MNDSVTVDDAISLLNDLIILDRPAIAALLANRVPCNENLAKHPTVQVTYQHHSYHVGMFGIINGLFGVDDHGRGLIRCVFDNGNLIRFERNGDT